MVDERSGGVGDVEEVVGMQVLVLMYDASCDRAAGWLV